MSCSSHKNFHMTTQDANHIWTSKLPTPVQENNFPPVSDSHRRYRCNGSGREDKIWRRRSAAFAPMRGGLPCLRQGRGRSGSSWSPTRRAGRRQTAAAPEPGTRPTRAGGGAVPTARGGGGGSRRKWMRKPPRRRRVAAGSGSWKGTPQPSPLRWMAELGSRGLRGEGSGGGRKDISDSEEGCCLVWLCHLLS